jgi:hypothetical protein
MSKFSRPQLPLTSESHDESTRTLAPPFCHIASVTPPPEGSEDSNASDTVRVGSTHEESAPALARIGRDAAVRSAPPKAKGIPR